MKPWLATFTLVCLFYFNCFTQVDSSDGRKHYPIKSCRIVFRFFNGPQSGTKTVIFDDWGNKEKEEVETLTDSAAMAAMLKGLTSEIDRSRKPNGPTLLDSVRIPPIVPVMHNLKITVERQIYAIDLDQHTGVKSPVFLRLDESLEEGFKQMGFTYVRPDTLLGQPSAIWEQPNGFRFWVWKGFYIIKKQMTVAFPGGMRVEEYPTKIDESYTIKPDEFKIPDNIKFQ